MPSLIYLISSAEKELLGGKAPEGFASLFGWRMLPRPEQLSRGKAMVAANLRQIADWRDETFDELADAAKAL